MRNNRPYLAVVRKVWFNCIVIQTYFSLYSYTSSRLSLYQVFRLPSCLSHRNVSPSRRHSICRQKTAELWRLKNGDIRYHPETVLFCFCVTDWSFVFVSLCHLWNDHETTYVPPIVSCYACKEFNLILGTWITLHQKDNEPIYCWNCKLCSSHYHIAKKSGQKWVNNK